MNHDFVTVRLWLFYVTSVFKNIVFAFNVHIINLELIFIDFYIILDWMFLFIFILNILITVNIFIIETVHNQKSNFNYFINYWTVFWLVTFYTERPSKQRLIIYFLISYQYIFILLKYFTPFITFLLFWRNDRLSHSLFFRNTLDKLTKLKGLLQTSVSYHILV